MVGWVWVCIVFFAVAHHVEQRGLADVGTVVCVWGVIHCYLWVFLSGWFCVGVGHCGYCYFADHVEQGGLAHIGPEWVCRVGLLIVVVLCDGTVSDRRGGPSASRIRIRIYITIYTYTYTQTKPHRPMKHTSGSLRSGSVSIETDPVTKSTARTRVLPGG